MGWLNTKRISIYPWFFVIMYVIITFYWYIAGQGIVDVKGMPIGSDYICFYAASDLANEGYPTEIYNLQKLHQAENKIVGDETFMVGWYYPPTFLLMVYPLSHLPYLLSLFLWCGITLVLYVITLKKVIPDKTTLGLILGFPAVFQNLIHGQNGFLTSVLIGAGLLFLEKYPLFAGILVGISSFKPQLALLVFFALLLGGYWRQLIAAIVTAIGYAGISVLVFGIDTWLVFIKQLSFATMLTEQGYLPLEKMSTIFAAARLLGIDIYPSYIIQYICTALTVLVVAWAWLKRVTFKVPILLAGIFLTTPYAFHYDLTLLGIALAWYGWEAHKSGWKRHEMLILTFMWIMPLINAPIAKIIKIQIVPLMLIAFIVISIKREFNRKDLISSIRYKPDRCINTGMSNS